MSGHKEQDQNNECGNCKNLTRRDFLKWSSAAGVGSMLLFNQNPLLAKQAQDLKHSIQIPEGFKPDPITNELINKAHQEGIDLVWDRQAECAFSNLGQGGVSGVCCFHCQMGPCTLGPATGKDKGACGATADIVVARNLIRRVTGGAASHVEHMREAAKTLKDVARGRIKHYKITDKAKLNKIYKGLQCSGENKALQVAEKSLDDLGKYEGTPAWLEYKSHPENRNNWEKAGILPTGAGAEFSQACHRTHMGVDADMTHMALDALKLGVVDGYCGLHAACDLQDVLFGTPKLVQGKANLSVIDPNKINIVVHGHEPILSEKIVQAAQEYPHPPKPIKIVGACCTGNELLMRRGVPLAASMVQQELAIVTGAVEAMVVDVQCIMPNIQEVARHYHTRIITTNPQAKITGAEHIQFHPDEADKKAREIVDKAVANYSQRKSSQVKVPQQKPAKAMAGFSAEQILGALSNVNSADPLKPLVDAIKQNKIRGIAAIVGCVTPREAYGYRHYRLTKNLLAKDILVVGTGCWSHVAAQRGLLEPDPEYPGVGEGLKETLQAVAEANGLKALPACWHMGSCVDNARIEDILNSVATYLNVKPGDLPVAASAPEFITEKAVSIGTWAVNMGLMTHIGGQPYVSGSKNMVKLLTQDVEKITGGKFYVQKCPNKAGEKIVSHINKKRKSLGLKV